MNGQDGRGEFIARKPRAKISCLDPTRLLDGDHLRLSELFVNRNLTEPRLPD